MPSCEILSDIIGEEVEVWLKSEKSPLRGMLTRVSEDWIELKLNQDWSFLIRVISTSCVKYVQRVIRKGCEAVASEGIGMQREKNASRLGEALLA